MPSEGQRLNTDVLDRPQAADTRSPAAKRVPAGGRDGPHEPEMDKSELDSWPGEHAAVVTAGTILRWALLLMSLAGVGAAGGFVAADYADEVYAARSEIAFDLRSLDWDSSERFLATQAVIARSRTVLKPIGAALSVDLKELEDHLEVATIGSSGVVRLQYASENGPLALDVVRALTDRYLAELRMFDKTESTGHWVLTRAFLLDDPIAPQPLRAAALGALAGLVVGVAVVLLRALARSTR